ncbi:MAG: DUF4198 domain-containing protein [Desulfarculaceae bacterium]|jgi:uncharacterized GH25 family protein
MPTASLAHSLYIQSSRYQVAEGKGSPLFFCYGHRVPVDEGLRAKKLKKVEVRTPGGEIKQVSIRPETSLHSYMVEYKKPGTYVLSAETNPGYYTVYTDKRGRKRHTLKPKSAVIDKAGKIEMSFYSEQFSKTYVVCGNPSEKFPARIGQKLELVPCQDITTLKAGDTLELKVYFKGKPYQGKGTWDGTYNGFSTEFEDYYYAKRGVTGPSFKVVIPRPGRWYLRYFIKIPAKGKDLERYTQEKNTATLVFQIAGSNKRPKVSGH